MQSHVQNPVLPAGSKPSTSLEYTAATGPQVHPGDSEEASAAQEVPV